MLEFLAQSQLTINKALKKWKSHLSAGRERGGEGGGGERGRGGEVVVVNGDCIFSEFLPRAFLSIV